MQRSIIDELLKLSPKRRGERLLALREKNIAFFKRRMPNLPLGDLIEQTGSGRYEIRVNQVFVDVYDRQARGFIHPEGKLHEYARELGAWHHSGWIDKMELLHASLTGMEHFKRTDEFHAALQEEFPNLQERMSTGIVQLPRLPDGRRYSGATVFLGIQTGLHIAHYLATTELRDAVFIEPDIERLTLSCFFLDYEKIEQRFGRLVLHVGEILPESPLDILIQTSSITARAWMRILPAYPSPDFDALINRVNLRWRALSEIFVPYDREIRNLEYAARNLKAHRPVATRRPVLSENSRIVVVGSGPSLEQDLAWLKHNREKLIIIAVHSAVRVLKAADIRPDFQCTLDTELTDELLDTLGLDPDVPLMAYYKASPAMLERFKTVLLFPEAGKANAVRFRQPVLFTHPTSGNSTMAMAWFMLPSTLYLVGMDLGFRDASKSHAAGTWYDDNEGAGHDGDAWRNRVPVQSNFPESEGNILTHAYLNMARRTIEAAAANLRIDGKAVFNLSDGAQIESAEPAHSSDIDLAPYLEREDDLARIIAAFTSDQEGDWVPYEMPIRDLYQEFVAALNTGLAAKRFDWMTFAAALDKSWSFALTQCNAKSPQDLRMEAVVPLLTDLLTNFYRLMLFTRAGNGAQKTYTKGLAVFDEVMNRVIWPETLDLSDNQDEPHKLLEGETP